jgi:hypothetical protein
MTLSEVSTLLPPPEGMEWREDPDFAHAFILTFADGAVYLRQPTGLVAGQWQLCAEKGDDCIVIYITVPDLPSAYRRALQAVGLAPDAEKEDMRRRLTWSEDVPTGDGLVLVWHPGDDEPEMWRTLGTADGIQWEHHNYVGHGNPFPPGTRFFPLANLKETP